MSGVTEILQLCRLCLVKDQVDTPIFDGQGDNSQISVKISTCLPVKVSRDDNLPKNICNPCSCKLDSLYQFWNTSADSEKQLLEWLNQPNVNSTSAVNNIPSIDVSHSLNTDIVLKQEVVDIEDAHADNFVTEDLNVPTDTEYLLQQAQTFEIQAVTSNNPGPSSTVTSETAATAAAPTRKRRAAAMKPLPPQVDSDEDDMVDTKIAKTEQLSDDDDNPEPTTFVGLPTDNEMPGPSGVDSAATSSDTPFDDPLIEIIPEGLHQTIYECEICSQSFTTKTEFLTHHINQLDDSTFNCCRCGEQFNTTTDLNTHYDIHKEPAVVIDTDDENIDQDESTEFAYEENVEAVMNIPSNESGIDDPEELLCVLDGSQCVNEVVIEGNDEIQETEIDETPARPDNFTIVQVEHGYMLPSVFKGQLGSKRRYLKKKEETIVGFGDDGSGEVEILRATPASAAVSKINRTKRRHEVPDFSSTTYVVLNPNEEVDCIHYKCLRCEQLFINKTGFFRHIEKGKCYINSCDVCSASFTKNSDFYEHYLAEHTDRAICNFCFRTFMYEKNVKEHMLRHLDQFRHRCEECNKGFYTVREYRNHYKNRHMGIRHTCDVCGRSFADEYYFKRHVATHGKAKSASVTI